MPARVGRRDVMARNRTTDSRSQSASARARGARSVQGAGSGWRSSPARPRDDHQSFNDQRATATTHWRGFAPPNAWHSAARRPGRCVRSLNMAGRLVGCNASLGGRCSGMRRNDRRLRIGMPARVGRRIVWRTTERLGRDLERPARVLGARDLSKARARGR